MGTDRVANGSVTIEGRHANGDLRPKTIDLRDVSIKPAPGPAPSSLTIPTFYSLEGAPIWDEFEPNLITLTVTLKGDGFSDTRVTNIGLRKLATEGTEFRLNGRPLFFRGTLECNIFPLAGYPPTDVDEWARVIKPAATYPHTLHIEFPKPIEASGVTLRQRQDNNGNGRVRTLVLETPDDTDNWVELARSQLQPGVQPQTLNFPRQSIRALRLRCESPQTSGHVWAAIAELNLVGAE